MLRQFAISIAPYPNLCTSSTDSDSAIATCSTVKPIASSWGIASCWSCFARSKPERYTHKMTIPIPAETILSNKSLLSGSATFQLCCDRSPLPTSKRAIDPKCLIIILDRQLLSLQFFDFFYHWILVSPRLFSHPIAPLL